MPLTPIDNPAAKGLPSGASPEEQLSYLMQQVAEIHRRLDAIAQGDMSAAARQQHTFAERGLRTAGADLVVLMRDLETIERRLKALPAAPTAHQSFSEDKKQRDVNRVLRFAETHRTALAKMGVPGPGHFVQSFLSLQKRGVTADQLIGPDRDAQVLRFSEGTPEVEKVRRFSETPGFVKVLSLTGQKPSDYVANFEAARKKRPSLTAKQFGVPA